MQYSIYFKRFHFLNTLLFILCIAGIAVQSLRQAGVDWWVIFSISGYSSVTVIFFLCVYLFAIFRSVHSFIEPDIEHPVTCLKIYKVIYCFTPTLGFLTGVCAQIGLEEELALKAIIINSAMGSFVVTMLFWVLLDPLITIMESYTPASKASRNARIEKAKAEKEKVINQRKQLLEDLAIKEKAERQEQKLLLDNSADELSDLILSGVRGSAGASHPEIINLGVKAWQLGGLKCMRLLRDMAWEKCNQKGLRPGIIDEVDYWWDGIGDWRASSL